MKRAFTLSEVLLTLGIIGVVAALTIPSVIMQTTRDRYVVSVRKAYNTLKAIEREAIHEKGDMKFWTWNNNETDFDRYYKPYFDILKECINTTTGCFAEEYFNLDDSLWRANMNTLTRRRIITPDGIAYSYFTNISDNRQAQIVVDINGIKLPNIFGRDVFVFELFRTEGIRPAGTWYTDGRIIETEDVDANCATNGVATPSAPAGYYCASKVLSEGAMNY